MRSVKPIPAVLVIAALSLKVSWSRYFVYEPKFKHNTGRTLILKLVSVESTFACHTTGISVSRCVTTKMKTDLKKSKT